MKKFEITREQIIELSIQNNIEIKLKKWFPDAFKTKFTGWAKDIHKFNKKWIAYYENDILKYGIDASGDWFEAKSNSYYSECKSNRIATEKEVETNLINEAKKRYPLKSIIKLISGVIDDVSEPLNGIFFIEDGCVMAETTPDNYFTVFYYGKWATIIETITKEEAEKLLNKKII